MRDNKAEHRAKGFDCWTQFVSMLFCQLAHADSLREICNGLSCCLGKLVHLGIGKAPNKSTLSYANEHRPAKLYEDLFFTALRRFRDEQGMGRRKAKFRFKNKLLSLDSTTISLCCQLFPWAKFRKAKGGVKAHVLLDHDDYLPGYVLITEAKRSDVKMADAFTFNAGSIVVMDRGYNDYTLWPVDQPGNLLCDASEKQCLLRGHARMHGAEGSEDFAGSTHPPYQSPGAKGLPVCAPSRGGLG